MKKNNKKEEKARQKHVVKKKRTENCRIHGCPKYHKAVAIANHSAVWHGTEIGVCPHCKKYYFCLQTK